MPVEDFGSCSGYGSSGGLLSVADDDVERAVHLGRVVLAVADVYRFARRHHLATPAGLVKRRRNMSQKKMTKFKNLKINQYEVICYQ